MPYVRTNWKERAGNGLDRFVKINETTNDVYLVNEPVSITEPGTNFSPENMNKIEQGLVTPRMGVRIETCIPGIIPSACFGHTPRGSVD